MLGAICSLIVHLDALSYLEAIPDASSHGSRTNLLLRVDEPLSLLPAEAHHLVPALAVCLMSHPLYLWLHPRLPKTVITIPPRKKTSGENEVLRLMEIARQTTARYLNVHSLQRSSCRIELLALTVD